ncbi:MAG: flagellar basal body rod protein FlgB [Pseudomonadales bacterium]
MSNIGIDAALGAHPHALQLRSERMGIIASNIAQADTPGYQARDIDFRSVLANRLGKMDGHANGSVHRTHGNHMSSTADGAGAVSAAQLRYRTPLMPSADSNTVDVQLEQSQLAENNLQFQASLQFLNSRIRGMMTAIRGE